MSPKVTDEHRESRSQEILDAARRVFARKGYEPATMKDVVEESGMSRGGVYMYFSSTEEMMLALLLQEDQDQSDQLQTLMEASGSVWEAIETLMLSGETSIAEVSSGFSAAVYEFYLTRWRIMGAEKMLEKRYEQTLHTFKFMIQRGVESGEFHPLLPIEDIVRVMISLMEGMTLQSTYLGSAFIKIPEQLQASLMMLKAVLQLQQSKDIKKGE
jgi:AcrR family transcriptional regulator